MTKLMEKAIDSLRAVPGELQDEMARLVMQLAGASDHSFELTPEEKADLDEADAEIERGEIATDEEMRAIWAKYGS